MHNRHFHSTCSSTDIIRVIGSKMVNGLSTYSTRTRCKIGTKVQSEKLMGKYKYIYMYVCVGGIIILILILKSQLEGYKQNMRSMQIIL
jgi:hypothetical protein